VKFFRNAHSAASQVTSRTLSRRVAPAAAGGAGQSTATGGTWPATNKRTQQGAAWSCLRINGRRGGGWVHAYAGAGRLVGRAAVDGCARCNGRSRALQQSAETICHSIPMDMSSIAFVPMDTVVRSRPGRRRPTCLAPCPGHSESHSSRCPARLAP